MKSKLPKRSARPYLLRKFISVQNYSRNLSQRPSYVFLKKVSVRLSKYRIGSRSAETAFYLLLALVPFMIFLVSLMGLLYQTLPYRTDMLMVMQDFMPAPVYRYISDILDELLASKNITFLSAGIIGFIMASSKSFSVIVEGLNQIYSSRKSVNPILLRFIGLLFALLLVLALLVSVILVTFGDLIFEQIAIWSGKDVFSGVFLQIIRYASSYIFLLMVFSLLYYFVSHRKGGFSRALPGAAITSGFWILFSVLFSWYVNNFSIWSLLYGSLSSIILLMFWLYFCSMMILTGAIIHKLILERYDSQKASLPSGQNQL